MKLLPALLGSLALLAAMGARAIEAPKQQGEATEQAAAQADRSIAATDETAFYERLQYVSHWRNLRGLKVPPETIEYLSKCNADQAVAALGNAAARGSEDANIALVRIQHWCSRIAAARASNTQERIKQLHPDLPPERASRAAGVIEAEAAFFDKAAQACRRAQFDYGGIEDRLRDFAASGSAASATELAQFTRDPKKREALLEQSAAKGYAPAMYALAQRRVIDVQRGERTEEVESIRRFLKQAGRTLPQAKVDLANCMALGCDGHPADAPSAAAFGLDAARDGEPSAFLSMMRMPWGRRLSRVQLLAWQQFGDRLNEAGCMGEAYILHATTFAQAIKVLKQNADEKTIAQGDEEAERLWKDNGPRAMSEQGCRPSGNADG